MSRSLNHNLNVLFPCTFGQLAKTYKLLDLAYVCCVSQTSRTAGITKGDGHIILAADIQDLVVVFIERILLTGHAHPCKYKRSSSGNDIHFSLVITDLIDGLSCDSTVKSYKVNTILCMESDYIDKIFSCQRIKISLIVDNGIINRNGSDHCRTLGCQLASERNGISVGRKIHDSMGAHVYSFHYFLHLYIVVLAVSGYPKVYIDLGAEHGTYALRIDTFVIFICTDRHLTGGYQRKQFLCCHAFLLSYDLKLRCDDAFTGCLHLCTVISHVKKISFHKFFVFIQQKTGCCNAYASRQPALTLTYLMKIFCTSDLFCTL